MKYQDIYQRLFHSTKMAGNVAIMMQAGILNEGKQVEELLHEDAYHKAMREAKTKADEIVQELLLTSLLPTYGNVLTLDVEEDTKSMSYFTSNDYQTTLILDPIDGTLDYLNQKDTYSICSAIVHDGDIKVAIVYFPARDELYGYCEGLGTKIYHNVMMSTWNLGEVLIGKRKEEVPLIIYKNSRLSINIAEQLKTCGFQVIDDQEKHLGCPDAIGKCLRGEALAYFSDTRNIRDILLGAILGKMENGHCYTFNGSDARWETHGRQKEIVFSIYDKKKIFK